MNIIKFNELNSDFFEYKEFENISSVIQIVDDVKIRGNQAISEYSEKFGDGKITDFEVKDFEIETAFSKVSKDVIEAIQFAVENVKTFAEKQLSCMQELEISSFSSVLGHKIVPLECIGAYVPGGGYPLPSSAIMSCVPAKVAGVKEVVVCSPKIQPATIVAAKIAGADKIFKIGGAQAIAGMAYGTETIPKVDKITGPGNKYVTAAKKYVYGACGIDFLAGPSEIMIIADDSANPEFIAADMLAQAEHDPDASAVLVTTSSQIAEKTIFHIKKFLETLPTAKIATEALKNSFVILVDNIDQAVLIANKKAPEHLEIAYENALQNKNLFKNYGSLFIGNYSAEVFGDYCSGTNHVLPTNGVARYQGGLSVFDFVKIQTYQYIKEKTDIIKYSSILAKTEGLMAHKLASDLRGENK